MLITQRALFDFVVAGCAGVSDEFTAVRRNFPSGTIMQIMSLTAVVNDVVVVDGDKRDVRSVQPLRLDDECLFAVPKFGNTDFDHKKMKRLLFFFILCVKNTPAV